MRTINIHQAKTHLSRLVEEAARGDPFVIAKAGKPIAKVVPIEGSAPDIEKRFGFYDGPLAMPEDFDRFAEEEIAALFEKGR